MMDIDRPVTRWRRDGSRPESKAGDDRPKSRRGAFQGEASADIGKVVVRPPSRAFSSYGTQGMEKMPVTLQQQRERLVSQQGLNVMRTGTSKGQRSRMIQDKRYFQGALQVKINDLMTEISNIHKDIEISTRDQATIAVYERRVKQMATELTELQGDLADHSMAIDKVNVGSDTNKIIMETKELEAVNNADVASLENLFSDRIRRQEAIREIETQIEKERYKAEQLEAEMTPSQREHFNKLKTKENEVMQKVEEQQNELNSLSKLKSTMSDQIYVSPAKAEMVQLELKLWELENKQQNLVEDLKTNLSPEEQRKELLNRVKQDNAQTLTMKKAIGEINEQIKEAESSLSTNIQVVDESKNARHAKYLELKNKEKAIEDFLTSVEQLKLEESYKLESLETEIVSVLNKTADKIKLLPTAADYKSLQLTEQSNSDMLNTMKSIGIEHKNLSQYLNKVEVMVNNVTGELVTLRSKISSMKNEIETFSNTDDLENQIDIKKSKLKKDKANLEIERPKTKDTLKVVLRDYNELQKKLIENESHAQITYSEKKLLNIEQNNFTIKEYLDEIKSEDDIETCRSKAMELVNKLNLVNRTKLV